MNSKSIKQNFIYNLLLKTLNVVFPIITFPYVARILSPDGIGKVDFSLSFIQYFILIAQVGIPTYGVRECSKYRDDKNKLSQKVQEILIINFVMMLFSYILLAIVVSNNSNLVVYSELILIMSLNIFGTTIGVEWLYQAIEEYRYIAFRSTVVRVLSVLSIFIFIKDENDYYVYTLITVMSTISPYIINFIHSKKYINIFKIYENYNFKDHIKPIAILFMMSIATSIYVNLDKVMLGLMVGDFYVGLYAAANKFVNVILLVVTSLGTVLLPRMSYYIGSGNEKQMKIIIEKSFDFMLMISIPAAIGIYVLAEPIIVIFAGTKYISAITTIKLLSPLIIIIGLSNLVGLQILISYGKEKVTLFATIVGAIVNLGLNFFLIPRFYQNGAAVSSIIAELFVTIVIILGANEYLKGKIRYKNLLMYLIGALIIFLSGSTIEIITGNQGIKTILTVISGVAFYAVFLLYNKNELMLEIFLQVKGKLKSIVTRRK